MIECKICGKLMNGLTLHLIKMHQTTPKEYCILYPGAKIFSDEIMKKDNFGGKSLKGKMRKKCSDETRAKMSAIRKLRVGQKHSPETISKMKQAAQNPIVKQARIDGLILAWKDPLLKERASVISKARIEKNGFHLKRGKSTGLEQIIGELLTDLGFQYTREIRSTERILESYRFFDFLVPELNLIIEADGEFWHRQESRIQIDKLKELDAITAGYNFLRISNTDNIESIKYSIINRCWVEHTQSVWERRMAYVKANGYTPSSSSNMHMTKEDIAKILSEKSKAAWVLRKANGWKTSLETRAKLSTARAGKTFGPRKPYKNHAIPAETSSSSSADVNLIP